MITIYIHTRDHMFSFSGSLVVAIGKGKAIPVTGREGP
jgi:hypothetical protein